MGSQERNALTKPARGMRSVSLFLHLGHGIVLVAAVHKHMQDLNVIFVQNRPLNLKVKNPVRLQLSMIVAKQAN